MKTQIRLLLAAFLLFSAVAYGQKPPLAAQIAAPSDSTVLWWLGHNFPPTPKITKSPNQKIAK